MKQLLKPVRVPTLRDEVVRQIEDLVLSGGIKPEQKLPPERDLAVRLGVSRPVVHNAIMDLQQKGLVRVEPRHGCYVNDYRLSGSTELLSSLWRHGGEELTPSIRESMMEFRVAVEQEAAARVARIADPEICAELDSILDQGDALEPTDTEALADHDYRFHFAVALHSGNLIYPMLMNSFRRMYLALLAAFFQNPRVVPRVRMYRRELVAAIKKRDAETARQAMRTLSQISTYED